MANVSDVLTTSAFKDAIVVAGGAGLTTPVKSITVAEVPDASDWLRGGEMICTTGFFVQDSSTSQVNWIENLIKRGAAALAIKPSRFLGEVSESVKQLADANQFPIIYLPNDATWPFIIQSVMNLISDEQVARIKRAEEIHHHLTQLVLNGGSVEDISRLLSNLVMNPVIVEDGRLHLMTIHLPDSLAQNDERLKDSLIQTRKQQQKTILHSEYYRRVLSGETKEAFKFPASGANPFGSITMPIIASNMVYGFLTLMEANKEHSQTDIMALEHGATTVALQLVKDLVQYRDHREKEQESMQALIHGHVPTSTLRNMGFPSIDWSSAMVVILIQSKFDPVNDGLFMMEQPEQTFEKTAKAIIQEALGEFIISYGKDKFTLVIPFDAKQEMQSVLRKIKATMEKCLLQLQQKFPHQAIKIAIGGIYPVREKVKKSYEDAEITLEIMNTMPNNEPLACFEELGVYRLFHMIKDNDALRSFMNDFLNPLMEHDVKKDDSLCETLLAYLRLGGSITMTAKQLFIHPNTVTYRLRKIQTIIGDPTESPSYRTSLLLALELHQYLRSVNGLPAKP